MHFLLLSTENIIFYPIIIRPTEVIILDIVKVKGKFGNPTVYTGKPLTFDFDPKMGGGVT